MPYASGTTVSYGRSREEIEHMLGRAGAKQFAYATTGVRAVIGFVIEQRAVRIELPLPSLEEFALAPRGRRRNANQQNALHRAEINRRWRSLVLVLRAKLTAVEDGISTIEREFLADIVLPDGRTMSQALAPQLEASRNGTPMLLPQFNETEGGRRG